MKECFKEKNFSPEVTKIVAQADAFLTEQADDGFHITLRGLYYIFIGRDAFPDSWIDPVYNAEHGLDPDTKNTLKNYKKLGDIVSDGRLAGLIDWDAIIDEERTPHEPSFYTGMNQVVSTIRSVSDHFQYDRWKDQEHYVELWVEKKGLLSYVQDFVESHQVTVLANKGYSSMTAMYDAAKRIKEQMEHGKSPIILYLGDFDPSGEDMVRDIRDRLYMFGAGDNGETTLEVRKIALTMPQVKQYKLPPNPAKVTDSRAKKYIAQHGTKSWELEALRPRTFVDLVQKELDGIVDKTILKRLLEKQETDRKKVQTLIEKLG